MADNVKMKALNLLIVQASCTSKLVKCSIMPTDKTQLDLSWQFYVKMTFLSLIYLPLF